MIENGFRGVCKLLKTLSMNIWWILGQSKFSIFGRFLGQNRPNFTHLNFLRQFFEVFGKNGIFVQSCLEMMKNGFRIVCEVLKTISMHIWSILNHTKFLIFSHFLSQKSSKIHSLRHLKAIFRTFLAKMRFSAKMPQKR